MPKQRKQFVNNSTESKNPMTLPGRKISADILLPTISTLGSSFKEPLDSPEVHADQITSETLANREPQARNGCTYKPFASPYTQGRSKYWTPPNDSKQIQRKGKGGFYLRIWSKGNQIVRLGRIPNEKSDLPETIRHFSSGFRCWHRCCAKGRTKANKKTNYIFDHLVKHIRWVEFALHSYKRGSEVSFYCC